MLEKPLQRLQYLIETVPDLLLQIPEAEFAHKPLPNKWSKKEIIGHLIDSATNNHQRFIRTQFEEAPLITYNPDEWVAKTNYQSMDSKSIIRFWQAYNVHLIEIIRRIAPVHLQKEVNINEPSKVMLQWIIEDYVRHMEHHLKKVTDY